MNMTAEIELYLIDLCIESIHHLFAGYIPVCCVSLPSFNKCCCLINRNLSLVHFCFHVP